MKIYCTKVLLYSFFILILGVSNTLQHLEGFPEEFDESLPFGNSYFSNFRLQYKIKEFEYSQKEHHDILMKHIEETQDLFAELKELVSEKLGSKAPDLSLKI